MLFSDISTLCITPLEIDAEISLTRIFAHFCDQPWAMLLDSAASPHPDARFDIMVAQPLVTLVSRHTQTQIFDTSTQKKQISDACPISLLTQYQQALTDSVKTPIPSDLPFILGALGYFGYDLARRFEELPQKSKSDYLSADMAIGLYSWSLIKDNHLGKFYLCYLDQYPAPSPKELEAMAKSVQPSADFTLTQPWQSNLTKAEYEDKIKRIHQYLYEGDCYQVNFAQRFNAEYRGDEWAAYLQLRQANQAPFSAFLRTANNVIISISPERFLQVKNRQVQTKPIKGTRPRSAHKNLDKQAIAELLNSEKDQAENLMIVDLLRNDLSRNCKPGTVKVPELFALESFAAVHHMVSTVTAELSDHSSPLNLLKDAFPGGSITGAPKIRAMQIIDELEPHARNIYCGSIGYLGINQDMDTSICIRTLLCEQQHIYCWAGGGIVIESDAASEYQESLDKVAKILPVLESALKTT